MCVMCVHGVGACMGAYVGVWGVHGKGGRLHAWLKGGMYGEGGGDMHSKVCARRRRIQAGSTHPTGMLSC